MQSATHWQRLEFANASGGRLMPHKQASVMKSVDNTLSVTTLICTTGQREEETIDDILPKRYKL